MKKVDANIQQVIEKVTTTETEIETFSPTEVFEFPSDETKEIVVRNNPVYLFLKRYFDILSSGLFLLLFGWFILFLMLIKYLEDFKGKSYKLEIKPATEKTKKKYMQVSKDGRKWEVKIVPDKNGKKDPTVHGAIYTSDRVGKDGKIIKFHKIRSMCKGAEAMKEQLIAYGINEADEPMFKLIYDPRITRVGRIYRKLSLDELPQIWDIFVGRISVVGPRNPILSEYEQLSDYQKQKMKVRGGLLCTWQVSKNRNKITTNEWINMDLNYIQKRSLWVDLKIIIKGVWMVLFDHSGE